MSVPANTRILVTGGAGFIGRYVVDQLSSDGFRPLITSFKTKIKKPTTFELVGLDLTVPEQVNDVVQNYDPQIVLHLAGVTGNAETADRIYDVNLTGTVNLLKACEKSGITRMVMLGTAAEYGDQPIPFREDMLVKPVSSYANSKARANQVALDMHSANDFPVTILRIFTAYGHGQPYNMFLSQLITHGILNKHFNMSDGIQKRDFIFATDVAKAIKSSMFTENANGRIINIAGGKGVALREVALKVWEICGAEPDRLDIGAYPKSGDDANDTEADISLAKEILSWEPGSGILSEDDDYPRLRETIKKIKNDLDSCAGQ